MREIRPTRYTAAALVLASLLFAGSASAEEAPLAAATRFARAFERQDFATVRALFAPDAMVSRVVLSRSAEPRIYRFSAAAWTDSAERNHGYLKDVRLEILDSTTQALEQGAVVSLRYRFSGRAADHPFTNDGIDTYWLIRVDGAWRVLQYGFIEEIELSAETKIDDGPAAVAHQFLSAFEKKDWATLRTLFAPNAVVSTINLTRKGGPTVGYLPAEQWVAQAEKELAPVTEIALTPADTSVLRFDRGTTVSVRFHSAGKVGTQASFTNDGIDTYSMIQVGGVWRILRYGTFELLEFR
jgi:hypothetical protein